MQENPTSFSLGAVRYFVLKHVNRKNKLDPVKNPLRLDNLFMTYNPQVKIPLTPGALLLMFAPTNNVGVHRIPAGVACKHP